MNNSNMVAKHGGHSNLLVVLTLLPLGVKLKHCLEGDVEPWLSNP
jgi:hypothetical protein